MSITNINRRTFNAGLLSAGLLTGIRPSLAQSAPKRGGSVRVALSVQSGAETLDPAKLTIAGDYIRGTSVYSYLTNFDENGQAHPELATSWEANDNATRWTFKVRKGIKFSDGSPLTLDDIVYSISRHTDASVASNVKQLASNIKSVAKDGDDVIVIELKNPDADLPTMLGTFHFGIVKAGATDFAKPISSGPFVVKEFQPGIRTVLERNPYYWKEGQPYIDRLELIPIADPAARANALLSGDVDLIHNLTGSGIDEVKNSSVASAFVTASTFYSAIQAAVDVPPGNNTDLNLCFAHLFDRKRFLDTVLKGYGTIANDHPFGPNSQFYNKDLPQRELDLDKAKFHHGKSGIGQAKIPIVVTPGVPYGLEMGQLMLREATRAGIPLDIKREPAEGYWTAIAGKRPHFATGFYPRPTYSMYLTLGWRKDAPFNYSHLKDDKLENLIIQASSTLDIAKRTEYFHEIQAIIYNSGVLVTPAFISFVDGVSNKIKGLKPSPVGGLGGFRFSDSIWVDA